MAGNVGSLNVRLGADISGLTEGMERAQRVVKRGADTMSKSAKASAQVFVEAKRSADSLLGSVDPLYAAQVRYDRELERAQQLMKAGALTAGEMAKVQAGLRLQLDSAAKSFAGVDGASGRTRAGLQQLGFQFGDIAQGISMGTKASTIFAQQSGQVIQSLQLMGGQGNKFLQFLGGPWGLALSAAAVVLTPLIAKLFETKDAVGDLVDKMRDQAQQAALNERANAVWKHSIEGVTETIRKQTDELNKQRQTPRTELIGSFNEQKEAAALAERQEQELVRRRATVAKQVEDLQKRVKALQFVANESAALAQATALSQLAAAQARLDNLDKLIAGRQRAASEAQANAREIQAKVGSLDVAAKLDPVVAATQRLEQEEANLLKQRRDGIISQEKYNQQLEVARKRLEAVKEATKGAANANREFGRQIDFNQATQIAKAAGLQVNSGFRPSFGKGTPGHRTQEELFNDPNVNRPGNPVARPGASAHNGANGKWAIDIQITDGVTPGKIRSIFAEQGVSLSKVLKEKGHFHVEGSRSEAANAENDAERAADRATKQQNDFTEARASLNAQLLQAQNELVRGVEGQAKIAADQIEDERARKELAIRNDLAEGRYGEATDKAAQARAEQLIELNNAVAAQRRSNVQQQKMEAIEAIQFRNADEELSRQIEGLQFRDEMAKTQAGHRRAQLAIIDAVYAQRKFELEHEKQLAIRNGATDDEIAAIQAKIDALEGQKSRDEQRAREGTKSPLQDYRDSLPLDPDQLNEDLENVAANGLKKLEDGLFDVITGAKSVKEAFHDLAASILADLLKIAIKKFIIGTIMKVTGLGAKDGGLIEGFAYGGFVSGPGGPRDDKVPAMLSNGEFVISAKAVKSLGVPLLDAMNSGNLSRLAMGGPAIPRMTHDASRGVRLANDNAAGMPKMEFTFHNDFRGADPASVAAIQARQDRFEAELPGRVVRTMSDARDRFVWREKR